MHECTGRKAMTTLNISLPDAMKAFVEARVQTGQYASASDYIRALVREDQQKLRSSGNPHKKRHRIPLGR
jgi:Arc/MetJ-type ribon-helix-helix transcriptional regulator